MFVSVNVSRYLLVFPCLQWARSKSWDSPPRTARDLISFSPSQRQSLLGLCHFNKESFLSCPGSAAPALQQQQALSRCCTGHFPGNFCNFCLLLSLCWVPALLSLLIISSSFLRGCLLIFLPLVKPSLLSSHRDLFPSLLLLFSFFLLITRRVPERSSALKWREILKNELVMRAINQSSLQPQQYEWVCWNERADEKWGTWIIWGSDVETFLYKVQRETLPSHGRGCPAGILIFSTQFLPAGSRGGFGGPGGVSVSVGAGRCAHLALLTWSLQQDISCCSSQQPQTCTVCTLELQI